MRPGPRATDALGLYTPAHMAAAHSLTNLLLEAVCMLQGVEGHWPQVCHDPSSSIWEAGPAAGGLRGDRGKPASPVPPPPLAAPSPPSVPSPSFPPPAPGPLLRAAGHVPGGPTGLYPWKCREHIGGSRWEPWSRTRMRDGDGEDTGPRCAGRGTAPGGFPRRPICAMQRIPSVKDATCSTWHLNKLLGVLCLRVSSQGPNPRGHASCPLSQLQRQYLHSLSHPTPLGSS